MTPFSLNKLVLPIKWTLQNQTRFVFLVGFVCFFQHSGARERVKLQVVSLSGTSMLKKATSKLPELRAGAGTSNIAQLTEVEKPKSKNYPALLVS